MTIVVGYSPSGQGIAALGSAISYAKRTGQSLVVASHVYNDPETGPTAAAEDAVREALRDSGADGVEVTVRTSSAPDIGDFLLTVAEEVSADLLVIGLRRKSRIGKLNLGASARRVILGATCPVLAVKDQHGTSDASRHARV